MSPHYLAPGIKEPDVSNWAFQVVEGSPVDGIPAVCIQDIIAESNMPRIGVLKVDIEGSEVEVLDHPAGWIGSIGTMIIELHDRFRPGCSAALSAALISFIHDDFFSGENMIITNLVLRLIE